MHHSGGLRRNKRTGAAREKCYVSRPPADNELKHLFVRERFGVRQSSGALASAGRSFPVCKSLVAIEAKPAPTRRDRTPKPGGSSDASRSGETSNCQFAIHNHA